MFHQKKTFILTSSLNTDAHHAADRGDYYTVEQKMTHHIFNFKNPIEVFFCSIHFAQTGAELSGFVLVCKSSMAVSE